MRSGCCPARGRPKRYTELCFKAERGEKPDIGSVRCSRWQHDHSGSSQQSVVQTRSVLVLTAESSCILPFRSTGYRASGH